MNTQNETDESKLSIKRVEVSLAKFNDVAIPHHLDLLRQHKTNIVKYEERGDYSQAVREQAAARRAVSRLRVLLEELKGLRMRVRSQDLSRFDSLTQRTISRTLNSIHNFLESPINLPNIETESTQLPASSAASNDSSVLAQAQLLQTSDLDQKEAALRGWEDLQEEARALRDTWQQLHAATKEQADMVEAVVASVETADVNTQAAVMQLERAERYMGWGRWGCMAMGTVCGVACGGPLGMAAGAKVGTVAAIFGAAVGCAVTAVLSPRKIHAD